MGEFDKILLSIFERFWFHAPLDPVILAPFQNMTDSDPNDVLRQLASIQRELRLVRWLLAFVSAALALLLFAPSWVAQLAEWESSLLSVVLPIGGFVALILIAAAVVSRFSPSQPTPITTVTKKPAV